MSNFFKKLFWPNWATAPCKVCGKSTEWLRDGDNGCTAEAQFKCNVCGYFEYRGGVGSEYTMERIA